MVGRYQFAHVLIQDTLARELSALRRVELHARIGDVLEDLYGANVEAHSDELAYHFLRGNDPEKAAEYTLKAGDRASAIYAWEQAIAQYETTVELLEKLEADPRQQAEALEKLARATGMSRGKDFLAHLEKATSLYEALGDRLKTGADLLIQAARGYRRDDNGQWVRDYDPCHLILFEDLSRYRMRTDRPRRENSQLAKWAHRSMLHETEMQGELYGVHVIDTAGVGLEPVAEESSVGKAEPLRGKRGHLADSLGKPQVLLRPHELGQHDGEAPIRARVGMLAE